MTELISDSKKVEKLCSVCYKSKCVSLQLYGCILTMVDAFAIPHDFHVWYAHM